jgi:hypothetical protein
MRRPTHWDQAPHVAHITTSSLQCMNGGPHQKKPSGARGHFMFWNVDRSMGKLSSPDMPSCFSHTWCHTTALHGTCDVTALNTVSVWAHGTHGYLHMSRRVQTYRRTCMQVVEPHTPPPTTPFAITLTHRIPTIWSACFTLETPRLAIFHHSPSLAQKYPPTFQHTLMLLQLQLPTAKSNHLNTKNTTTYQYDLSATLKHPQTCRT